MIGIYLGGSSKYGCIISTARGTWNFVRHLATLAQGSASEAHMNMEVNLCRLPEERTGLAKFLVPLAVLMRHPCSVNCADIA
ncbi:hypothetical protein DWV68_05280 [Roseburia sp. AF12-17LB]|uniref:hypothetical protein n=1 Tax=Roseburia sp. AF12-17LB TaxID=2293127 RepID=UPI000E4AD007|nr:hypothetical protein [Roseburia sp. AF12-17LB]RHS27543.1 hypothetical protein DWV68_05280 [Roseburia sp. AF12-17LB]